MDLRTREFLRLIEEQAQRDPVPCNGCTACCRGNQSVKLMPEMGDDAARYPGNVRLERVNGPQDDLSMVLARQPNGDCVYLQGGKCAAYNFRPVMCRGFDCRRTYMMFTDEERKVAASTRVFPQMVFDAAEERLHTVSLSADEKKVLKDVKGRFLDRLGK